MQSSFTIPKIVAMAQATYYLFNNILVPSQPDFALKSSPSLSSARFSAAVYD